MYVARVLILLLLATLVLVSCSGGGSPRPITEEDAKQISFDLFKKAVKNAEDDGYTPYWLGREFEAGGLTFGGPYVGNLPGQKGLTGGGVEMSYSADGGTLTLLVYSPAAWEKGGATADRAWSKHVQVAGQDAKLAVLSAGTRPVSNLMLLLTFGQTTVLAIANSGGAATPGGPDVNPLIDEAMFLAVMDKIRPYPE